MSPLSARGGSVLKGGYDYYFLIFLFSQPVQENKGLEMLTLGPSSVTDTFCLACAEALGQRLKQECHINSSTFGMPFKSRRPSQWHLLSQEVIFLSLPLTPPDWPHIRS
jgi:hypothetical protein